MDSKSVPVPRQVHWLDLQSTQHNGRCRQRKALRDMCGLVYLESLPWARAATPKSDEASVKLLTSHHGLPGGLWDLAPILMPGLITALITGLTYMGPVRETGRTVISPDTSSC